MSDNGLYEYGPPVTIGDHASEQGTPEQTTGEVTTEQGASPLSPPPNTETVFEPGGAPSDDVMEASTPYVESLAPAGATAADPDTTVTLTGTGFRDTSVVTYGGADLATTFVDESQLTAVFPTSTASAGDVPVTVRNPSGLESQPATFTIA